MIGAHKLCRWPKLGQKRALFDTVVIARALSDLESIVDTLGSYAIDASASPLDTGIHFFGALMLFGYIHIFYFEGA